MNFKLQRYIHMYKSSNPINMSKCRYWTSPRMYVHPVLGEDRGLIRVLEGKLARLTQRVPNLQIEHIPAIMQEFVVGVPLVQIRLMRRVARELLVYIDVVEVAKAEEAEEARVQGDQGDQGSQAQTQGHFDGLRSIFCIFFVYYTVMTGSEDQRLDLSMDRYSHTHTHTYILLVYLQMFFMCMLYIFMKNVLNSNPRCNQRMHQLMNSDFLECD